ncbi:MAG: YcxB family protein [Sandaracinaceae bacterium]
MSSEDAGISGSEARASETTAIRAECVLESEELDRVENARLARLTRPAQAATLLAAALAVVVVVATSPGDLDARHALVAVALLALMVSRFRRGSHVARRLGAQWEYARRITVEIDDDRFSIESGLFRGRWSWEALFGFRETEDAFLVYWLPESYYFVPKRALDPDEATRLRELLERRIPASASAQIDAAERRAMVVHAATGVAVIVFVGALTDLMSR